MAYDPRLQIDMTPDGKFRPSPRAQTGVSVSTRIIIGAVLVGVLAAGLAFAALALWLAMALIPVAIGAAVVAYVMFRFKLWQARRRATVNNQRGVAR